MARKGSLRIQIDRWPLGDCSCLKESDCHYLLSIIVVGHFTAKPTREDILKAIKDAGTITQAQSTHSL